MADFERIGDANLQNSEKPALKDRDLKRADRVGAFLTSLPKWTAYAIIAWQARLSIEALAGKNAVASLLIRFGRETSYWELACWAAGLLGILYGGYSHHLLRRQMTADMLKIGTIEKRLKTIVGATDDPGDSTQRSGRGH